MLAHEHRSDFCHICKQEQTSNYAEPVANYKVFICENCLEAAHDNFVFICMHCGKVYLRQKELFLEMINDPILFQAYFDCKDLQIIQGIDRCYECEPERIDEYMKINKVAGNC